MTVRYNIDFHIPVKEASRASYYELAVNDSLTVEQLLALLAERFSAVQSLMRYRTGQRLPVAVLVNGRILEHDETIPDGALVKIIGAVAGG